MMFKTSILIATSAGLAGMLQGCEPTKEDICENYEDEAKKKQCKEMKKEGKDDDEIKAALGDTDVKKFCDKYPSDQLKSTCQGMMNFGQSHDQIKAALGEPSKPKNKKQQAEVSDKVLGEGLQGAKEKGKNMQNMNEDEKLAYLRYFMQIADAAEKNGYQIKPEHMQMLQKYCPEMIGDVKIAIENKKRGGNWGAAAPANMSDKTCAKAAKAAFDRMTSAELPQLSQAEKEAMAYATHAFKTDPAHFAKIRAAMIAEGVDEMSIDAFWKAPIDVKSAKQMAPAMIAFVVKCEYRRTREHEEAAALGARGNYPLAPDDKQKAQIDQAAGNIVKASNNPERREEIGAALKRVGFDDEQINNLFDDFIHKYVKGGVAGDDQPIEMVAMAPQVDPKLAAMMRQFESLEQAMDSPDSAPAMMEYGQYGDFMEALNFAVEHDFAAPPQFVRRPARGHVVRGAGKGPAGGHGVRAGKGPEKPMHVRMDVEDFDGDYGVVEDDSNGKGDFVMAGERDNSDSDDYGSDSGEERDFGMVIGRESGSDDDAFDVEASPVRGAKRGVHRHVGGGHKRARHGHGEVCCHN